MGQVAASLTPATAADVAGAIVSAYKALRGRDPPTRSSWLWPLALSANETDSWRQMWNFNAGNVTTADASSSWFSNPHVTVPLKFLSFDTLAAGARSMLSTLDHLGGLSAADAGDEAAWQAALNAYLGGGTYPPLDARIAALSNVLPSSSSSSRSAGAVASFGFGLALSFVLARGLSRRRSL